MLHTSCSHQRSASAAALPMETRLQTMKTTKKSDATRFIPASFPPEYAQKTTRRRPIGPAALRWRIREML